MNAPALLLEITARGATIRADGDRLKVRNDGALTPDLRAKIAASKRELLLLLAASTGLDTPRSAPAQVTTPTPRPELPGELLPSGALTFNTGASYDPDALAQPETPPALLEFPGLTLADSGPERGLWLWCGQVMPTLGTLPAYRRWRERKNHHV